MRPRSADTRRADTGLINVFCNPSVSQSLGIALSCPMQETTPNLDYGDAFPSKSKKKRKTM